MIALGLALIGAVIGGLTALAGALSIAEVEQGHAGIGRGGNRKDIAQYATGYGFAFLIVGMIATVLLDRALSL